MVAGQGRRVLIVGANPGICLFDGETVTAFASVWRVDWSPDGAGHAVVLWRRDEVRLLCDNPGLGRRLERDFTRHFPEVAGLPWPEPEPERVPVRVEIDLETGVRASAGDVEVEMTDVLDRRAVATEEFELAGIAHGLSLVLAPCGAGRIIEGGRPLPGMIERGDSAQRPSSSAFLAEAEVWRGP